MGKQSYSHILNMTLKPLLFVFAFITTINFQVMAAAAPPKDVPQLSLSRTATLERPADQVTIMLGVVTTKDKASDSIRDNAEKMKESLEALEKAGLTKSEYQTSSFGIEAVYAPRPREPLNDDWREIPIGYRVSNQLIIKTSRINDVGKLIDAATGAGTNSIKSIDFGLKEQGTYRNEAIILATKNAMADADTMATAAGISLVRLLNVSIDNFSNNEHRVGIPRARMMAETNLFASGPSTSIQAGDVTIQVTINIVYEIKDKDLCIQDVINI